MWLYTLLEYSYIFLISYPYSDLSAAYLGTIIFHFYNLSATYLGTTILHFYNLLAAYLGTIILWFYFIFILNDRVYRESRVPQRTAWSLCIKNFKQQQYHLIEFEYASSC